MIMCFYIHSIFKIWCVICYITGWALFTILCLESHYVNSFILVMFFTKFIKLYSHRITISLCESFHWHLSASSISRRVIVMGTMTAERSLKSRFKEHQRPSSTISEVSNTFTLNILSILWNWRTLKSWWLNPDGLKEEWRKLSLYEPWTLASTETVEGITFLRYGTTSLRRGWRQTGQGEGEGGHRFCHHAHLPHNNGARRDWWSWQESVKAFI